MPEAVKALLVLVVDDEQIIADSLTLILNQNGFDARPAYSGETAVVLARALRPDVLISDVCMRFMNGVELAIRVCTEVPGCKAILLSGQTASFDLLRDAESKGYHFEIFTKPVHPQVLLDRLAHLSLKRPRFLIRQ